VVYDIERKGMHEADRMTGQTRIFLLMNRKAYIVIINMKKGDD